MFKSDDEEKGEETEKKVGKKRRQVVTYCKFRCISGSTAVIIFCSLVHPTIREIRFTDKINLTDFLLVDKDTRSIYVCFSSPVPASYGNDKSKEVSSPEHP